MYKSTHTIVLRCYLTDFIKVVFILIYKNMLIFSYIVLIIIHVKYNIFSVKNLNII